MLAARREADGSVSRVHRLRPGSIEAGPVPYAGDHVVVAVIRTAIQRHCPRWMALVELDGQGRTVRVRRLEHGRYVYPVAITRGRSGSVTVAYEDWIERGESWVVRIRVATLRPGGQLTAARTVATLRGVQEVDGDVALALASNREGRTVLAYSNALCGPSRSTDASCATTCERLSVVAVSSSGGCGSSAAATASPTLLPPSARQDAALSRGGHRTAASRPTDLGRSAQQPPVPAARSAGR
jgi:hypothetical protein